MGSIVSIGSESPVPFEKLVSALSAPAAFPGEAGAVECVQTHISAVFLVGNLAYKVKKPKDLGFLDFSTLDARRHYCHEEVRLNRRLARGVYTGVVPIVRSDGGVRVLEHTVGREDSVEGPVVEWAVRMIRLPGSRTLDALLASGEIGSDQLAEVARRVARFHEEAERSGEISRMGGWETVAGNSHENFEQIGRFVGDTLSEGVHRRLEAASRRELDRRRTAIEARAGANIPCDTHGDLRLEHVYLLPPGMRGRSPGGEGGPDPEIVIIDCVEFNRRYRWADPVSDMAFLFMELEFRGRHELARAFAEAYFESSGDDAGADLLPLYATYRDVVRGKVRSLQAIDSDLPADRREAARSQATHHFLSGLVRLSEPPERPAILSVFGLPGVGKSTIARAIAREAGFEWIDTDRVRRELAEGSGGRGEQPAGDGFEEGLYTPEWTERTYEDCIRRAREIALDGGRVLVEGSFRRGRHRRSLVDAATRFGVPVLLLECRVGEDEARRRLVTREAGDSEADWGVYRRMADAWEPVSSEVAPFVRHLSLDGSPEAGVERALAILAEEGLAAVG